MKPREASTTSEQPLCAFLPFRVPSSFLGRIYLIFLLPLILYRFRVSTQRPPFRPVPPQRKYICHTLSSFFLSPQPNKQNILIISPYPVCGRVTGLSNKSSCDFISFFTPPSSFPLLALHPLHLHLCFPRKIQFFPYPM